MQKVETPTAYIDRTKACRLTDENLKAIHKEIEENPTHGYLKYHVPNAPEYSGAGFRQRTFKFRKGKVWVEYTTLHLWTGPFFEVFMIDVKEGLYFQCDPSADELRRMMVFAREIYECQSLTGA